MNKNILSILLIIFTLINSNLASAERKQPTENNINCIERTITARNIKTEEIKEFNNTCDIKEWWVELWRKWIWEESSTEEVKKQEINSYIIKLQIPETDFKNRAIVMLSKDYEIKVLNSTFWESIKTIKKWTSSAILMKNQKLNWEIYLQINKNSKFKKDLILFWVYDWDKKLKTKKLSIKWWNSFIQTYDKNYLITIIN